MLYGDYEAFGAIRSTGPLLHLLHNRMKPLMVALVALFNPFPLEIRGGVCETIAKLEQRNLKPVVRALKPICNLPSMVDWVCMIFWMNGCFFETIAG